MPFDLSKAALEPHAEQAARFSLPARSREKLEQLNQLCNRQLPGLPGALLWEPVVWAVSASSTIEDEGLPNELIEKLIAHTEPGEHVSEELRQRLECHKDIGHAYLGLLRNKSLPLMTPDLIKQTHRLMFERARFVIAGVYKNKEVVIRWHKRDGKEERVPTVSSSLVDAHIYALSACISKRFESTHHRNVLLAAEFACDFLAIHPFVDGNGRLARLLSGYLLKRVGYTLIEHYAFEQVILDFRAEYYEALNAAQAYWRQENEDLGPWMVFFIDMLFEHSQRALRMIELRDKGKETGVGNQQT